MSQPDPPYYNDTLRLLGLAYDRTEKEQKRLDRISRLLPHNAHPVVERELRAVSASCELLRGHLLKAIRAIDAVAAAQRDAAAL